MRRTLSVTNLCLCLLVALGGCIDTIGPVDESFSLTFQGDASFQGPHGGQAIMVALIRTSDRADVLLTGTVSATADPAFSFSFPALVEAGVAYEVHYWIDSNVGGGTVGVCDPKGNDHQRNVASPAITRDVTITEAYNATNTMDVCSTTFTKDLAFTGDASFQGTHGGDPISVAVVRASDGALVALQTGTVSGTVDPAFSFSFPGLLVRGVAYQIHYWIDSNLGGGTAGVCDPKANDHQWNVVASTLVLGDVTVNEVLDTTNTVDVCSTFL